MTLDLTNVNKGPIFTSDIKNWLFWWTLKHPKVISRSDKQSSSYMKNLAAQLATKQNKDNSEFVTPMTSGENLQPQLIKSKKKKHEKREATDPTKLQ